ncbi:MAG TPA: MFS transporter [Candidatus Saccharimonadales bacterium]|nr:MFS transporter [Candidatus Saccharimonadales bacterium]
MTKQQRLVLVVAIMASIVAALDVFIVNVALPTISHELGGGLVVQQWTVDAYLITLGALILIAGSLSDLLGRVRVLRLGLIWFGLTSILCALAPNGATLVASRALQGVGGALLMPSSLALIIAAFSGPAQGKAIGRWSGWLSIATIAGPLLGGLIIAAGSWRWIFAVNVLPIGVTLWLLARLHEPNVVKPGTAIDRLGAVLCAIGLGGPVFALIEQPNYGWSSPLVWVPGLAGLLVLGLFVWHEHRTAAPMLPLSLFRSRNFSAGNLATLAIYAGLSVSTFLIVITLQQVGGYSALQASLATMPTSIVMFLLSGRFGALAGRFGPRLFMTTGPLVAAVGFLLMERLQPQVHYLADLLPGVLVFALGLAITVAPLTSAVLGGVEKRHAGVASAVNNAVARVAGLLAIAFVGVITGPRLNIQGFHRALVVIAVLLAVGGLISFAGIRNQARAAADQLP